MFLYILGIVYYLRRQVDNVRDFYPSLPPDIYLT